MDKKSMKQYQKSIYGNPHWTDGRINRLEYFGRMLLLPMGIGLLFVGASMSFVSAIRDSSIGAWLIVAICALMIVYMYWRIIMTYVKRLHDLGWTGWLVLLIVFYPIVSFGAVLAILFTSMSESMIDAIILLDDVMNIVLGILSLILLFKCGTKGINKYGKDPLVKGEE